MCEGALLSPKEDGALIGPSGGGNTFVTRTIYREIERIKLTQEQYGLT